MAKKEAKTDLWVAKLLDDANVTYDAQGSDVLEINQALATASKNGSGKAGYPEYVFVSDGFVVVVEDKASLDDHVLLTSNGVLDFSWKAVRCGAVNGACHYARCIAQGSTFRKVFAVGVSGNEKAHRITPYYVDDRGGFKQLADLESFVSFSRENIYDYYMRNVFDEPTDVEMTTEIILRDAAQLHEYLRTYGSLKDQDKRSGAVGNAFYHPYKALVSNDCRTVNLKENVTADCKLFVARAITEQKDCFSYSRKLGTARAKKMRVMLPIDDDGNPDWAYMASYSASKRGGAHALLAVCSRAALRIGVQGCS